MGIFSYLVKMVIETQLSKIETTEQPKIETQVKRNETQKSKRRG
ncbi:hypothetical protein [Bacillus sp. FJAT-45066]|nr:hypothetical protein [Bacillus sp. FJAT-45066]